MSRPLHVSKYYVFNDDDCDYVLAGSVISIIYIMYMMLITLPALFYGLN